MNHQTARLTIGIDVSRLVAAINRASNILARVGAAMTGQRYWADHKHQMRRTTGQRPLLHNGGKPR